MSAPGEPVRLLRTSVPAAIATVERLAQQGIEADVGDLPNRIVQLLSGGNYQVSVLVAREALEPARAELERWHVEAGPRVASLARDVQRGVLLALTPGGVLALVLLLAGSTSSWAWGSVLALLFLGLVAWVVVSRRAAGPRTDV